jgi:hypothetical protein
MIQESPITLLGIITAINLGMLALGLNEKDKRAKKYVAPFVFLSAFAILSTVIYSIVFFYLMDFFTFSKKLVDISLFLTLTGILFLVYYLKFKFFG